VVEGYLTSKLRQASTLLLLSVFVFGLAPASPAIACDGGVKCEQDHPKRVRASDTLPHFRLGPPGGATVPALDLSTIPISNVRTISSSQPDTLAQLGPRSCTEELKEITLPKPPAPAYSNTCLPESTSQDLVWMWILKIILAIVVCVMCLSGFMVIHHGLRTQFFVCPYCAHEVRPGSGFMVSRRARAFSEIRSRRSRSQRLLARIRLTALKLRRLILRLFRPWRQRGR
jgi:hypothetical protein